MDLFQAYAQRLTEAEAPLAARMRPRTLEEYIGQSDILGEGRLLRRAIAADQLSSLIFYGPPGTGKTTLAQVIANRTQAQFLAINAVLAGIKDIREAIAAAQDRRGHFGQRTILFVDEVHRFNKAQQDALLPWVENGTVILIGATTENPFFEVNKALVSRSRLFRLQPLSAAELGQVIDQALGDRERGYGDRPVELSPEARNHLVQVANGDARSLLNALELAVETTPPDDQGLIRIDLAVAEQSIQQRAVLYDREGDAHFDTISAFIKSVRGSDPDAALYWLARMVYAGEDPRFIFRRLLIAAGEDIGLADPQGMVVVEACAAAFDRVGLPEGLYPLAQATLYLATAPKSNSLLGFFEALKAVEREQADDIPNHLKDANRDRESLGHGAGYRYPHAFAEHWVAQQYLPANLLGQVFYQPSDQGYEGQRRDLIEQRREAQLAAMAESDAAVEAVSFGSDARLETWLQRTLSPDGDRLLSLRRTLFERLKPQRHHRLLVIEPSPLLLWEAVRQVPEGGVWGWIDPGARAQAERQIQELPSLQRPWLGDRPEDLAALLSDQPGLQFEAILIRERGQRLLESDWRQCLQKQLAPGGQLLLLDRPADHHPQLWRWLTDSDLPEQLLERIRAAEATAAGWTQAEMESAIADLDWAITRETLPDELRLTLRPPLLARWFDESRPGSFRSVLTGPLTAAEIDRVETAFRARLGQTLSQSTPWWLLQAHG